MTCYQEGIGHGDVRVMSKAMIKRKLLLVAIIAASILIPAAVQAGRIQIEIGDRPFYNHGPRYWDGDYAMIWIPAHWVRGHHWIHGHYVRGERRQHNRNGRYQDRNDYRDDYRR